MNRRIRLTGAIVVLFAGSVVWWYWPRHSPMEDAEDQSEIGMAKGDSAAFERPEPKGGFTPSGEGQSAPAIREPAVSGPQTFPFYPIRDDPGAEAHIKAAEPLERILTPISSEDQQWMERYQYPQLADIQTADWRELERQWETMPPDGRPSGQNRHTYVANVLAAAKYRAGDPTWREWAERTTSPFSRALLMADAAERFKLDPSDQDALRDLNRWWPRAFATGERAYAIQLAEQASRIPRFYQGYHRFSPADAMAGIAEIEKMNAYRQSRGLPPMVFSPRPAPQWTLWGSEMNPQPGTRPGP